MKDSDDDQTPAEWTPNLLNSRSPDSRFQVGRERPGEGIPDSRSAGIGNREVPRFPIRPGPGIAGPGNSAGIGVGLGVQLRPQIFLSPFVRNGLHRH